MAAIKSVDVPVLFCFLGLEAYTTKRFFRGAVLKHSEEIYRVTASSREKYDDLSNSIKDSLSGNDIDPLLLRLIKISSGEIEIEKECGGEWEPVTNSPVHKLFESSYVVCQSVLYPVTLGEIRGTFILLSNLLAMMKLEGQNSDIIKFLLCDLTLIVGPIISAPR